MKRKYLLLTVLLASVLFSLTFAGSVSASPTAISIDAVAIWDPEMGPCTMFTVDIVVDYVEKLWGYQFELSFNPDVIHGVSVENGPFLGSAGGTVIVAPGPGFDNEAGTLGLFGAALYPKRYFPTGGGVLATVTFHVVGYGESHIVFGENTGLADPYGRWIVHGWGYPGYFANMDGPELYVRRRGASGVSGIIPEWTVGVSGQEQTFSSKVLNYGHLGASVYVEYYIKVAGYEVERCSTDTAELGPVTLVGNKWIPDEVVVSTSFMPEGIGHYHAYAVIYFKAGGMTDYYPFHLTGLEGEGQSRDTNVCFRVLPPE